MWATLQRILRLSKFFFSIFYFVADLAQGCDTSSHLMTTKVREGAYAAVKRMLPPDSHAWFTNRTARDLIQLTSTDDIFPPRSALCVIQGVGFDIRSGMYDERTGFTGKGTLFNGGHKCWGVVVTGN